jgi:predicted RNA binding protein YcfA (HicA-like mRNA interferase family)
MIPPELRGLTARELVAALERDGFGLRRTAGSHHVYRHRDGRRVVVAMHGPGATFPPGTLAAMLEATGWTEAHLKRLGLLR